MATSYSSTSNQRAVMPTVYLGDSAVAPYPESSSNMVCLNYSCARSYPYNLPGNSQPQQKHVELPVTTAMLLHDLSAEQSESTTLHQGVPLGPTSPRLEKQAFGVWRDGRNEVLLVQPTKTPTNMHAISRQINNNMIELAHHSVTEEPLKDFRMQLGILQSGQSLQSQGSNVSAIQGQGLSLSLSTQVPSTISVPSFQYRELANAGISFLSPHLSTSGDDGSWRDDGLYSRQLKTTKFSPDHFGSDHAIKGDLLGSNLQCSTTLKNLHHDATPYGLLGLSSDIPNCKYLMAAKQLLYEVVNVRTASKQDSEKHQSFYMSVGISCSKESDGGLKDGELPPSDGRPPNPQDSTPNSTSEVSPAERQDLQNKMTKLLEMLDEVDRRYKQYYHQVQTVVSSFDVIAGCGAAKPYTGLALQTMSRHFRCLQDAISGQIKVTKKNLGEPDGANGNGCGISRRRFIDQQLRQQKAFQQNDGLIQQHGWRPQRGLPESSVSILRAWLFEHFLHPYPKDSDKIMLSRQTGLTRSQVSNWFINARVRLWKPMVEEIYKEEIGDAEMDSNSLSENTAKQRDEIKVSMDREELQSMKSATECPTSQFFESKKSEHTSDVEMAVRIHEIRNGANSKDTSNENIKLQDEISNADDCRLVQDALIQPDGDGKFMAYQMAELGRFGNGGVSLTLGLQHCDRGLPVSGVQHNFISAAPVGTDAAEYGYMGNQRHGFGSLHLLHDFVP